MLDRYKQQQQQKKTNNPNPPKKQGAGHFNSRAMCVWWLILNYLHKYAARAAVTLYSIQQNIISKYSENRA